MKACRVACKSESERHHIRGRQGQPSWSSAKDKALASISPRRQQRHADVCAHRFESRGIEKTIGRGFDQPMFGANRANQTAGAICLFEDANFETVFR